MLNLMKPLLSRILRNLLFMQQNDSTKELIVYDAQTQHNAKKSGDYTISNLRSYWRMAALRAYDVDNR